MSDHDDTSHAAASAAPEASKGWSEQDRRTLIITISGTLAANLATVILVGLAIGLVHWYNDNSSTYALPAILVCAGGGLLLFAGLLVRDQQGVRARVASWLLIVGGSLGLLLAVLVWAGLASGVK
jgi:hypothetical protein